MPSKPAGSAASPARTESCRVAPPATTAVTLRSGGQEIARFALIAGGHHGHDRVHFRRGLEGLRRAQEEGPAGQREEGLGPAGAHALSAPGRDEHGHAPR